jgi:hypothetical protein
MIRTTVARRSVLLKNKKQTWQGFQVLIYQKTKEER